MTVPDGRSPGIEASKQKALERVNSEQQQQDRVSAFDSNSFSLLDGASGTPQKSNPQNAITQSQEANREVSQLLNDFYSTPKTDPQVEELKRQVEELESRLETKPQTPPDPMEIAEKQYALAAKYFNNGEQRAEPARNSASKTVTVHPVRSLGEGVVTTLATVEPDSLLSELGRERNLGFNTAVGSNTQANHRGIRVCVGEDQRIRSGDPIRLRLTEPIRVNDCQIDAGSLLFGTAAIEGQRLQIVVSSIEQAGNIIPVELSAFDLDGGKGLYVPDSKERTAAKEAAASIGSGLGTSISFTQNAGQQVAMDLVRGAMTGGTQYIASKLRQVKVTVKAGYQIILISKE